MVNEQESTTVQTVYAAIELGKTNWVVSIALPDRERPSLHRIAGGDLPGLLVRLRKAAGGILRIPVIVGGRSSRSWARIPRHRGQASCR